MTAMFFTGCIAIPMGTETFTTEYPTEVSPTDDPPTKTCEVDPVAEAGDEGNRSVSIGLAGTVIVEQAQSQQYARVEVVKKKRLAIGLAPLMAQTTYHPDGALTPMTGMYYVGDGKYSTMNMGSKEPVGAMDGGKAVLGLTLGILSTPFSMMAGIFGPFEKDYHFLGGTVADQSSSRYGNAVNTSTTYNSKDIDLLQKFPMSDRVKIGAWTYHENAFHPHNTFWHGFEAQWFGVAKYCNYLVKDKGVIERTTPAAPNVTRNKRNVPGPYGVTLSLPTLGFLSSANVKPGETTAVFNLLKVANGDSFANGTIRFLPPPGGLSKVLDDDDRAILELAMGREWPVTVKLPAPMLGAKDGSRSEKSNETRVKPLYSDIRKLNLADGGFEVRVKVNDASQTLKVHKEVSPDVRQLYLDEYANEHPEIPTERIRVKLHWRNSENGAELIYTADVTVEEPPAP